MKTFFVSLGCVLTIAGCASMEAKTNAWKGQSLDDLVLAWGPPATTQPAKDGGKVVSYSHSHSVSGTSYDCRVWFFADTAGRIYKADGEGSIGGCNRLLGNKKMPGGE